MFQIPNTISSTLGQQIKAKNGRGDNVESVDMEMSDDDNEEYVNQSIFFFL